MIAEFSDDGEAIFTAQWSPTGASFDTSNTPDETVYHSESVRNLLPKHWTVGHYHQLEGSS